MGSKNLYGFVNNTAINTIDFFGLDFIALAARLLRDRNGDIPEGTGMLMNHLSVERWECACPVETYHEYDRLEFENTFRCPGGNAPIRVDQIELLQDDNNNWIAWRRSSKQRGDNTEWIWEIRPVGVAIISRSSDGNRFSAFYQPGTPGRGDNEQQVANMWEQTLILRAQTYPYAEQAANGNFQGIFQHWPFSHYQNPPGYNSNTFARWMVNLTGQPIPDLRGVFPGRHLPGEAGPVNRDNYHGNPELDRNRGILTRNSP